MQFEQLGQAGLIIACAVFILKQVFDFLIAWKGKKENGGENNKLNLGNIAGIIQTINRIAETQSTTLEKIVGAVKRQEETYGWLKEIHEVVSRKDGDGVPLVYSRKLLLEELRKLVKLSEQEMEAMEAISRAISKDFIG